MHSSRSYRSSSTDRALAPSVPRNGSASPMSGSPWAMLISKIHNLQ